MSPHLPKRTTLHNYNGRRTYVTHVPRVRACGYVDNREAVMSRSWAKGSTRQWRKTRVMVLARDEYRCQVRLPGICTGVATHVHHKLGRALTGDDPAYLAASCEACNLAIGDPQRQPDPPPRPRTAW